VVEGREEGKGERGGGERGRGEGGAMGDIPHPQPGVRRDVNEVGVLPQDK
jgi:hypothetical protein